MNSPPNIHNPERNAGPLLEYLTPLRPFLEQADITEVCVNRPFEVFTEGQNGWRKHPAPDLSFELCEQLVRLIASYTEQRCDETSPILSATLPYGERVQVVIPPAVPPGCVSLTIRKPPAVSLSLEDYEQAGAFEDCTDAVPELTAQERQLMALKEQRQWKAFLQLAVASRQNIIVSGATGSGKTTFMKALIALAPASERLITIENVDELGLYRTHPNAVGLFYSAGGQGRSKVTQQHLLESALRMKPDRIFLAELIRGDEAFYLLRNVNSGHPGSITSMHANSARMALEQLVLFIKESQAGHNMSREDIKQMLFLCVDIIVQFKVINGRRRVSEVYYDPVFKRKNMV